MKIDKNYWPFIAAVVVLLLGVAWDPERGVRTHPAFYAHAILMFFGLFNLYFDWLDKWTKK